MSRIKINNIIPKKLGEVIDCRDVPLDNKTPIFKERVIRIINNLFSIKSSEESAIKNTMECFWNMIKDPNKKMGVVAIDGYYNDTSPYGSDIGLVFNMGAPILRARKKHPLDTIYVHMYKDNTRIYTKYYNSPYDMNETNFTFKNKVSAWHPHISGTNPCYGGYETRLHEYLIEKDPVLYLKTINQFLYTWYSRSAYFNINTTPMYKQYKENEKMLMSKLYNSIYMSFGEMSGQEGMNEFVINNYDKIEIDKDQIVKGQEGYIKLAWLTSAFSMKKNVVDWINDATINVENTPQITTINALTEELDTYGSGQSPVGSILNNGVKFLTVKEMSKSHDTYLKETNVYNHHNYWENDERERHQELKYMLYDLCKQASIIGNSMKSSHLTEKVITTGGIDDIIIRLQTMYLEPMAKKLRELSDNTTLNSKSLSSRTIFRGTSFYYNGNNELLIKEAKKYNLRRVRVYNLINSYASKMINNEIIIEYINSVINAAFKLEINDAPSDRVDHRISTSSGIFWLNNSVDYHHKYDPYSEINQTRLKWLKEGSSGDVPSNYDEFIRVYNNIQVQLNNMERLVLLRILKKAKRKLNNGLQTNNTRETVQQVPLFFD